MDSCGHQYRYPHRAAERAEDDLTSLVFEVGRELRTIKDALDALDRGGGLLAGATGTLLKRSLQAIDRALLDAAEGLSEDALRQKNEGA